MDYNNLKKILLEDKPSISLRANEKALFEFIPAFKISENFNQHNTWHIYDVYEHTLHVIDGVPPILKSRLVALFHDMGKPYTFTQDDQGVGHFYGHWDISKEIFLQFAHDNNLDNELTESVAKLIEYHDIRLEKMSDEEIMTIFSQFTREEIDLLFMQKKSDLLAQNSQFHYLLDSYKEQKEHVLRLCNYQ